jgi:hypothetical protein
MANVIYLRCHYCGEPLLNRDNEYCPECNLYLAYRAMPLLLGMILTGHLATDLAQHHPNGPRASHTVAFAYEDEATLIWE